MSVARTAAPCACSASATVRPIPLAAPVTIATLPWSGARGPPRPSLACSSAQYSTAKRSSSASGFQPPSRSAHSMARAVCRAMSATMRASCTEAPKVTRPRPGQITQRGAGSRQLCRGVAWRSKYAWYSATYLFTSTSQFPSPTRGSGLVRMTWSGVSGPRRGTPPGAAPGGESPRPRDPHHRGCDRSPSGSSHRPAKLRQGCGIHRRSGIRRGGGKRGGTDLPDTVAGKVALRSGHQRDHALVAGPGIHPEAEEAVVEQNDSLHSRPVQGAGQLAYRPGERDPRHDVRHNENRAPVHLADPPLSVLRVADGHDRVRVGVVHEREGDESVENRLD